MEALLIILFLLYLLGLKMKSESRVLLIDDMRNIKADRVARNYEDGIAALTYEGPWETLYLDHDLASYDDNHKEKTGYDIMCFLEEHKEYLPGKIVCVSSNPVGRRNIQVVIDKLYAKEEGMKLE